MSLASLPKLPLPGKAVAKPAGGEGGAEGGDPRKPEATVAEPATKQPSTTTSDVLGALERLGELQRKGILTEEEFAAKKADLLSRL